MIDLNSIISFFVLGVYGTARNLSMETQPFSPEGRESRSMTYRATATVEHKQYTRSRDYSAHSRESRDYTTANQRESREYSQESRDFSANSMDRSRDYSANNSMDRSRDYSANSSMERRDVTSRQSTASWDRTRNLSASHSQYRQTEQRKVQTVGYTGSWKKESGSWKQDSGSEPDYGSELQHLTEIQEQIHRVQQEELARSIDYRSSMYSVGQRSSYGHDKRSSGNDTQYTVTEIPIQRGNSDLGSKSVKSEEKKSRPTSLERKDGTVSREAHSSGRSSREAASSGRDSTGSSETKHDKNKKDKKSFSSIFKIFRKKSSKEERKKSSLSGMIEKSGSVISPDVQKTIIENTEDRDTVSPTRKLNL